MGVYECVSAFASVRVRVRIIYLYIYGGGEGIYIYRAGERWDGACVRASARECT